MYAGGTLSFLPQMECTLRCPDSKKGQIFLQWLECRRIFHLKNAGMSECPVETLEKALVPSLVLTAGLTSL